MPNYRLQYRAPLLNGESIRRDHEFAAPDDASARVEARRFLVSHGAMEEQCEYRPGLAPGAKSLVRFEVVE